MGSLGNAQQMWAGGCGDEVEDEYLPMNTHDSPTTSQLAPDIISGTSMTIQSDFSLHIGTVYMVRKECEPDHFLYIGGMLSLHFIHIDAI